MASLGQQSLHLTHLHLILLCNAAFVCAIGGLIPQQVSSIVSNFMKIRSLIHTKVGIHRLYEIKILAWISASGGVLG
jgi:hypothetical protein